MTGDGGFHLDRDQRQEVRDCLKHAGVTLVEPIDRFFEWIEASIDQCLQAEPEGTLREAYGGLREIWLLCQAHQPSPAGLRTRLHGLPPRSLEQLGRRARVVIPKLFDEPFESEPFEPPSAFVAKFLAWAASAPDDKLVRALTTLSREGGQWVKGRSRGSGKRSAPRFEPSIMGIVRGSPGPKSFAGRPSEDARQALVMHLAGDWSRATGQMPEAGRSDRTGFGGLVHSVFQWVYVPKAGPQAEIDEAIDTAAGAASYCLRRFWEEVEQRGRRSSEEDFLRHGGEEP